MLVKTTVAAACLVVSASVASATQVTYNLNGYLGGYFPSMVFTSSGGPSLTVTPHTVSSDGSTVSAVTGTGNGVGQWSPGLGILNSSGDNSHTVDGLGLNDLLNLNFSSAVRIVSAKFGYAGIEDYGNDGFAFFADDGDAGTGVDGDMVFSHEDIGANSSGYGTYDFLADAFGDIFSTSFGFAAIWDQTVSTCVRYRRGVCKEWKSKTYFDTFKLKSITVELLPPPSTVPVPAALPLLASALGLGGWLARRRQHQSA
jgi:hypothetical protein